MFVFCATLGLVFLASKYRDDLLRGVKNIYLSVVINKKNVQNVNDINNNCEVVTKKNVISLDKIILADSPEKSDYAVQRITCHLSDNVLGLDCEWVNEGRVSLLQLATKDGLCALFRLGKIGYIPAKLKALLANESILKVGVAPYEDGLKLKNDYGCSVVGTVDLRTLADRLKITNRKSLAALSIEYLDIPMDKLVEIRCGDWDAEALDQDQIEYAAFDAIASVLIYHQMQKKADHNVSIWRRVVVFIKKSWGKNHGVLLNNMPQEVIDTRYRGPAETPRKNNTTIRALRNAPISPKVNSIPIRKEPLYHNCYLQAPDGETLCTCDRKKALWYIKKGLGTQVIESPLTVKLNFEPSGRASGEVGQYYTQEKVNQCVVCGAKDKFIKKNVVPREYRKYFPVVMKAHQSHDVLLLCPHCHAISNRSDLELRKELETLCSAPLVRNTTDQHQKRQLMSALNALNVANDALPAERRRELESRVSEFTGQNLIQSEQLSGFFNKEDPTHTPNHVSSTSHQQMGCPPHGLQVVQYFSQREGGLVMLEKTWREHFLTTMEPKFLPKLWSVHHNQQRLQIRQVENRIDPADAKVAGVAN